MSDESDPEPADGVAGSELIGRIRDAQSLRELSAIVGADSLHDAYFRAKEHWKAASEDRIRPTRQVEEFPGDALTLDGADIAVHGVTHADSEPERTYVREHVTDVLESGGAVYCEQGIRSMYLADVEDVCQMDDYRWAMAACERLDATGRSPDLPSTSELEQVVADLSAMAPEIRDATYSLIESGRELYGAEFASALGDVASAILASHEDVATGRDFEAFRKSRAAARDPTQLASLQRYYWHAFLPQPVEREWLRRHDPELELLTHARNERMADFVVNEATASEIHVVVGAAHQPGVTYYLVQYRDGEKSPGDFEYVA